MHEDLKPICHLPPEELRALARWFNARADFHRGFSDRQKSAQCWLYALELRSLAEQRDTQGVAR